jgi:hypothetical protein
MTRRRAALATCTGAGGTGWADRRAEKESSADPAARTYKDIALTPVSDDEEMTLDLLTNTTGGAHTAVRHLKKIAWLTGVAWSV